MKNTGISILYENGNNHFHHRMYRLKDIFKKTDSSKQFTKNKIVDGDFRFPAWIKNVEAVQ